MQEYDLSEGQLDEIFNTQIVRSFGLAAVEREPVISMVAAQPGAGKTREVDFARASHGYAPAVVGDDYRKFHPAYDELMDNDPLRMPDATAQAAGKWVQKSLAWLRHNKRSLVIETTMRHPVDTDRTLSEFKQAGYRCEMTIVATPPELSLMGTLIRYINQSEQNGQGRWADPSAHDEAVAQMPKTLETQIAKGNVDHVMVVNRTGDVLCDTEITAQDRNKDIGQILHSISAGQRFDSMTSGQRNQWQSDKKHIEDFIRRRPDQSKLKTVYDRLDEATKTPRQATDKPSLKARRGLGLMEL